MAKNPPSLALLKLLHELDKESEDPPLEHYPEYKDFLCRYCHNTSEHIFCGVAGIVRRRPRLIPKTRIVAYRCGICKYMTEFQYCPPNGELKFTEARVKDTD